MTKIFKSVCFTVILTLLVSLSLLLVLGLVG
jgi:hypothetical protein